jgi:hypothetical protein
MPISSTFPISVKVNWSPVETFTDFSVNRSVDKFIDTFSMTFSNFNAESSLKIPIGGIIEIYNLGVLFFRGLIENKKVSYPDVGSTMTVSWREEILVLAETDVDPTVGPFKWYTDNAIITKLVTGYPWQLSLWTAKKIKEYTISGRSIRIWQVIEDVCKMNDFLVYKKGNILYKRPRPDNTAGLKQWPKYYLNLNDGIFYRDKNRIIWLEITEDITSTRSKIRWYTYTTWKKKTQAKVTLTNHQLTTGSYASRIRNQLSIRGYKIDRIANCMTPAKDTAELEASAYTLLRSSDLQANIVVEVYGIQDVQMLEYVRVDVPVEMISQNMFVRQVEYTMTSDNRLSTKVTLMPFMNYHSA